MFYVDGLRSSVLVTLKKGPDTPELMIKYAGKIISTTR
jgi:hypothetical protein